MALRRCGILLGRYQAAVRTTAESHRVLDENKPLASYADPVSLLSRVRKLSNSLSATSSLTMHSQKRALTISNLPRYSSGKGSKQLWVQNRTLGARNGSGGNWSADMSTASNSAFGRPAATSDTQILSRVSGVVCAMQKA